MHPLVGDQFGLFQRGVVFRVQAGMHGVERFRGERFARLRHAVGFLIELGEHRLPEEGGAEAIEQRVEQEGFALRMALHQLHQHEHFVAGAGHLRHKQRIIGHGGGLLGVAQVAVHGVAHFVRDGQQMVQIRLVVYQHEGVHAVSVRRIGAERLPSFS